MAKQTRGQKRAEAGKNIARFLRNKGLDVSRQHPHDEGLGSRERRGLAIENSKVFGGVATQNAITGRVRGDVMGRRDERR